MSVEQDLKVVVFQFWPPGMALCNDKFKMVSVLEETQQGEVIALVTLYTAPF